jgi:hypothetical protein
MMGASIDTYKRCVDEMALQSHILPVPVSVFLMHI